MSRFCKNIMLFEQELLESLVYKYPNCGGIFGENLYEGMSKKYVVD